MRLHYGWMGAALVAAVILSPAAARPGSDADSRAREYVQFLVQQLDQWTRDLPKAYDMAMMRAPVDVSALSEAEKSGADNLRESVRRLSALSQAPNLLANAEFRAQLDKTVLAATPVNDALSKQRFPEAIQSDWGQVRTTLNSLASAYERPGLAVLDPPAPGSGRKQAVAPPPGAVTGYVVDQRCAASGKAMWTNVSCVQKCVRDGDKVVLVTEQGKVFQFATQDKIDPESYGQKVAVTGKTDGDVIAVATFQIL